MTAAASSINPYLTCLSASFEFGLLHAASDLIENVSRSCGTTMIRTKQMFLDAQIERKALVYDNRVPFLSS